MGGQRRLLTQLGAGGRQYFQKGRREGEEVVAKQRERGNRLGKGQETPGLRLRLRVKVLGTDSNLGGPEGRGQREMAVRLEGSAQQGWTEPGLRTA